LEPATIIDVATKVDSEDDAGQDAESSIDEEDPQDKPSEIDPEQDVVSFIEEVLHEDVRSWINDTDSLDDITGNKTRGGHADDMTINETNVLSSYTQQNDEDAATFDGEIEQSQRLLDIVEEDKEVLDKEHAIKTLDRTSLEASEDKESDAIVSVVTWNLAEESPGENDAAFIRNFRKTGIAGGTGSDLVLISGQECENIKPRRSEGRRSREFRRLMIMMLGKQYVPVAMHLLGGIQFGLFAKRSFLKEIEEVAVADVTCGIGNVFHNKGAIAAFVKIKARNNNRDDAGKRRSKTIRMVLVTAHMAAHVKNADARDQDFWRISSELEAQVPEGFLPQKIAKRDDGGSFLFDSVDHVFFCGDLNYRLDLPRELTEYSVVYEQRGTIASTDLLCHDQLIHSMAGRRAFPGFLEGKIKFDPTFKFDKESGTYDTSHKQRIPAWTDRILFRSPSSGVSVLEYESISDAQHSDHRPVYGTFRVNMEGKELQPQPSSKSKKKQKRKSAISSKSNGSPST
jgi:phosphatidylinositol-bisphosphatase